MFVKSRDLIAVTVVASLALLVALLGIQSVALRAALALPLILFLPGYALAAALFPGRAGARSEQVLLSLGLSLALAALGGLLLNLLPAGLQGATWAAMLWAVTMLASGAALARRRQVAVAGSALPKVNLAWRQALILAVGIALVAGALGLARLPVPGSGTQGYTTLWFAPAGSDQPGVVRIGVSSLELQQVTYRLELRLGERVVNVWPETVLAPGDSWEQRVDISGVLTVDEPLTALLYRQDNPDTIYRYVTFWPDQASEN